MAIDPAIRDHQAWLGYLQPDGLVVSPAALVDLQAILPRDTLPLQERFLEFVEDAPLREDESSLAITDFAAFAQGFLGWPDDYLYGIDLERPVPDALRVVLSEFGETLEPTMAFADPRPKDPDNPWLLLLQVVPCGTDLDTMVSRDARGWAATPARRFERLLRETKVPIGLITNGIGFRLMYAPRGENAGSITFPVSAMTEVAGRPILAAFDLLLRKSRLLTGPMEARLPGLLAKSREYQSSVSTKLAEQVLDALYEFLRGFQADNERTKGELLRQVLADSPDDIYAGLLTVLMRLVFLLYAEDRGLMPCSSLYVRNYSVHGLFEKLRADNEHYPDTMDHRFGAWPQLLALFRAVHDGSRHQQLAMPRRRGYLFDPTRFPFLMGAQQMAGNDNERRVPLVADGVIFRVLHKLMVLDGERLSYRTLDVEQIGSVYETMMGFRLKIADGPSIALKPAKRHGAPAIVNLEALLTVKGADRAKWLAERTDLKFTGEAYKGIEAATNIDGLLAVLERKIARNATPHVVPLGAMALQPSDERRRSGSHYTPRSLTEPIVYTTLRPVLQRLGASPTPKQILSLKVCDIAVGSGAFLVETCRQLGDELVKAWHAHQLLPIFPLDEDEVLYARRLVAQRCLYGVDRNHMAADLAKLSLWLVTLAKDHPFTFLDHAIRCGDSVVGLTRQQIVDFHWQETDQRFIGHERVEERIKAALKSRREILDADDDFVSPELKRQKLDLADAALNMVRESGDLVVAAFFGADKDKARKALRDSLLIRYNESFGKPHLALELEKVRQTLLGGDRPVVPFHWEIEFPEVFDRKNAGFDAIVGNPPFAGVVTLATSTSSNYTDWLRTVNANSGGKCDLVAFFFRQAWNLLSKNGAFGLIATKTIAQGDTRRSGLAQILQDSGSIFAARRRFEWPGQAAVFISVVMVSRFAQNICELDGKVTNKINSFLLSSEIIGEPKSLSANQSIAFLGCKPGAKWHIVGGGREGYITSADVDSFCKDFPAEASIVRNYVGGAELYTIPSCEPVRKIFGLGLLNADEAARYPNALNLLARAAGISNTKNAGEWWLYARRAVDLYKRIGEYQRVLVRAEVSDTFAFVFIDTNNVFSNKTIVFLLDQFGAFGVLQSTIHEDWARLTSSTQGEGLSYVPSYSFDTFPFPLDFASNAMLEMVSRNYYEFRASLMVNNNEGLTKTYNRFHDPTDSSREILRLRELHAALDRVVLDCFGWGDISIAYEFLLEYDGEDDPDEENGGRRRKKPWRYRWSDAVRDEVLARLLKLNTERSAEEERLAEALIAETHVSYSVKPAAPKKRDRKKQGKATGQGELFDLTYPTEPQEVLVTPSPVFDPAQISDGAWARPLLDQSAEVVAIFAAVLKAIEGPKPARYVRLAALLASEPRLLTPALTGDDAMNWVRLIGAEAEPLAGGVASIVPRADRAWGSAVQHLRSRGQLVEDPAAGTWAPGTGLDVYYTEGWPEGRAQMVLNILNKRSSDGIIHQLPGDVQRWVYDKAA